MVAAVPQSVMAQRQSEAPFKFELVITSQHEETPNSANKSKWSMGVALLGRAHEHTPKIIEKVVYELDPSSRAHRVTAYPPFYHVVQPRSGSVPTEVRCQIHWAPVLGIRPTNVDHRLMLEERESCTFRMINVDRDALDTLELEVLNCVPSSIRQLPLNQAGPAELPGRGRRAFKALALDVPQRRPMGPPLCFPVFDKKTLMAKDVYPLEVVVGNRYRPICCKVHGQPCHEWTLCVMLPGLQMSKYTMIEQVIYNLHHEFTPDTHILNSPKLILSCASNAPFAPFEVTCTIRWNPALGLQPTTLVHELIFDELGGGTKTTISVSPRRMQFFA